MTAENLYTFFETIEECKNLVVLKLDGNDFAHHWFAKVGERL